MGSIPIGSFFLFVLTRVNTPNESTQSYLVADHREVRFDKNLSPSGVLLHIYTFCELEE